MRVLTRKVPRLPISPFRRKIARRHLTAHEIPMTFTSWPRLGVTDGPFCDPQNEVTGKAMQSLFVGDEVINEHVRFPSVTLSHSSSG